MKKLALVFGSLMFLAPISAQGFSFSSAPGYALATHLDDFPQEWLGTNPGAGDGLSFTDFNMGIVTTISVDVTLDNFAAPGANEWLSIWADWDQNMVFDDDEKIYSFNDLWFDNGTTNLAASVLVPTDAVLGNTWMRARLTFDGPLLASGDYFTGEVEDYAITVNPGAAPVPEPATLSLLAVGLLGSGLAARRIRRADRS